MIARVLLVLVLTLSSSAVLAQDSKGPLLHDLLKRDDYRAAWNVMLARETVPDWIKTYATTLDGPPVPTIDVELGREMYSLGFTCKPNECGGHQLYVLFAPEGRHVWGMLLAANAPTRWLGDPDDSNQGRHSEQGPVTGEAAGVIELRSAGRRGSSSWLKPRRSRRSASC